VSKNSAADLFNDFRRGRACPCPKRGKHKALPLRNAAKLLLGYLTNWGILFGVRNYLRTAHKELRTPTRHHLKIYRWNFFAAHHPHMVNKSFLFSLALTQTPHPSPLLRRRGSEISPRCRGIKGYKLYYVL